MGVKSTQTLTREEAVEKFVELKMENEKVRRQFVAEAQSMDNRELADEMQRLNDANRGGEGYRSYEIEG